MAIQHHPDQQQQRRQIQPQVRLNPTGPRPRTGLLRGNTSSSTIAQAPSLPMLDQGGCTGFNGVVFGSSNGDISASSLLHQPGLGSRLGYDGAATHDPMATSGHQRFAESASRPLPHTAFIEQLNVLHRENLELRRDNQRLASANEARQKAAISVLKEVLDEKDEGEGGDGSRDQRRKQLAKVLLASLDTFTSASGNDLEEKAAEQQPLLGFSSSSIQHQAENCADGSRHSDWNSSALAEIANQGTIAEDEAGGDKYASESRRAIGSRTAATHMQARRISQVNRRSCSIASSKSNRSLDSDRLDVSHPGSYPDDTPASSPVSRLEKTASDDGAAASEEFARRSVAGGRAGSLAASLLGSSPDDRFVQDVSSRFVLYSPSAGTFQASTLDGLRSGEFTLADIVEASRQSISLEQLRARQNDSSWPSPASTEDVLHIAPTSADNDTLPAQPALGCSSEQADKGQVSLPDAPSGDGCFWIDVTDPTPEEMSSLARVFGIHPLTVEDIMTDEDGRDKFESFLDYTFMVYRTIDYDDNAQSTYEFNRGPEGIATASFSIVLKQSCILTFHRARELDHLANVLGRLQDLAPPSMAGGLQGVCLPVVTPAYIAYALIDDITDTLGPEMRGVELEVDAVDELVLILSPNEQADMLQRIGTVRRKILAIWRLLQGKPEVIRAFSKLMERQAQIDDMFWSEMAEVEEAERTRKALEDIYAVGRKPQDAFDSQADGLRILPSSVPVSPRSTLPHSAYSTTAVPQLVSARRKNMSTIWPPRSSNGLTQKRREMLMPVQPSNADLAGAAAAGGESEGPVTAGEIAHYLSDVYDHLVSLVGSSSHCDMVLSRAHSNYLARISLELGEATVETNVFASRWTVIGAILVPLNVITGLWGMNVMVPGQDREDLRDFFLILAGCIGFIAIVIIWARFKKIF